MSKSSMSETMEIRVLISQIKAFCRSIERTITDTSVSEVGRFSGYKLMAETYNDFVDLTKKLLTVNTHYYTFNIDAIPRYGDDTWPQEKMILENVLLNAEMLLAGLEGSVDFADDEFDNVESFIQTQLRSALFEKPEKEVEVQNAIEALFLGRNWKRGNDYDRESGKFEFSGKEFILDFVIPKYDMCVEVKLLKEGRKSSIIEEISADITAYKKRYSRLLFVVYDLGAIQNEVEFKSDINIIDGVKVIVVKH